ncbi:MAG TPA: hypothetical protein VGQ51_10465 [Puia sp.]|jgi:hypothetical protein|nr:hypothetical protein [Puia sp.]
MQQPPTLIPSRRPPYKKGFWCLIPLIGAFVGLTILLIGIFRYKDVKYTLIGLLGIAWTVIIYSSLYLYSQSPTGREGFKFFTQNNLNQTVAEIELYHIQRGRYPDSLQQLKSIDSFPPIWDPMQRVGKSPKLNYGRVGDKYFLFSSGLDGIPHTKDDLYPQIAIHDSSKIGLIRPE